MITKLTLKNFKSFGATGGEIPLGPLTLIVGTNASGKSNIRDALRFLHGIGRGYSLAEIIGGKYSESGEKVWDGIRGGWPEMVNKNSAASSFTLIVETSQGSSAIAFEDYPDFKEVEFGEFRYCIEVGTNKPKGSPVVLSESLEEVGKRIIFTTITHGNLGGLPIVNPLQRDKKTGGQIRAESGKQLSPSQPIITQLAEYPERLFLEDEAATAFLHNLMLFRFFDFEMPALRKPSVAGVTHLGDRGHNLSSVLQSLCEDEETRVSILRWLRELTPSDVDDLAFPTVDLADRIQVALKEKGGHVISAESASDGTIRFLAFLAIMFGPDNGKSLFIEEIENGIHPNRIDLLVRLAQQVIEDSKTQILATTHSPALLSFLRGKSLDDAILVSRSKRGSVARRFCNLQLPEKDKERAGELLQDGWFEVEADHLESEKRKGGKP